VSHFYWSNRTMKTPNLCDTWRILVTPCVLLYGLPCHRYGHATSALYGLPRGSTACPVSIKFFCLFDFSDRTRYLLHTDFVCESKYTAGIRRTRRTQWHRFRRIPSTFIFEHFSSPIRLLDLFSDHTSPQKDLLVPKRLLTSQQSRDRPPDLSSVSELCPVHLSHQDQL
jgi:hypothetical protein